MPGRDLSPNVERFTGYADCYDAYRPEPPAVLAEILARLAQVERPALVVDLGSGTGLSTTYWAERAEAVVGIEPSSDMRRQAEARAALETGGRVRFQAGFSTSTGLPDRCADIVTCSQSLHWMEPEPTFAEVARILRPGGVFAAYDCDWPPTVHWEAEAAYQETIRQAEAIGEERGFFSGVQRWEKREHLARMRASHRFRSVKEILVHSTEAGSAERLGGLCRSQGSVATLLKRGVAEEEIGLDILQSVAERALGDGTVPWYWRYRVRVALC
ncbi:MAG: class I SAM-dependent methyltransferase [Dehalococcoidia bacterium]